MSNSLEQAALTESRGLIVSHPYPAVIVVFVLGLLAGWFLRGLL